MQIHPLTTQKHAHEMSWFCFSLPQPAFYLAGPQCTVHDSLSAQGLHQGDEWSWAAPAVLLPGEGTRILRRWAPVSFSQAGPQTTQKSQLEKILLKKKKKGALLESVAMLKISWVFCTWVHLTQNVTLSVRKSSAFFTFLVSKWVLGSE